MTNNATPVVFENKDGFKLFGIVEQPEESLKKDTAVILLSPGIKSRVAPHRLYNKMASRFVSLGYTVLRFDFYGLGDSEGEIDEEYLADFYGSVQVGRYVEDTITSLDWMESNYGFKKIILAGLCGGAITGLLSGNSDKRVVGLLGLGIPVTMDGTSIGSSKNMSKGQLNEMKLLYLRKLFSIKAWYRLLTLKSEYRVIGKIMHQLFPKNMHTTEHSTSTLEEITYEAHESCNSLFTDALYRLLDIDARVLFIFSGADRLAWEFEEYFWQRNRSRLNKYGDRFDVHTVKNANHIFSSKEWCNEMLLHACKWLEAFK